MSALSMRAISLAFSAALLAAVVPACSTNTVLDAANYDATCKVAADCTDVLVGDICACGCESAAIATSESAKFQADDTAAREGCDSNGLTCVGCESVKVDCVSGKCAVVP